ncbi:MAG: hypothetical protein ACRCZS_21660 [Chroococcidiopsis sp.]
MTASSFNSARILAEGAVIKIDFFLNLSRPATLPSLRLNWGLLQQS